MSDNNQEPVATQPKASPQARIKSSRYNPSPVLTTKNLSVLMTGIVFLVALFRAEPKDIPEMVKILAGSNPFSAVGWALAIVFLIGGIVFVVVMSRIYGREIERLTQERDRLQAALLDKVKEEP